MEPRGDGRGAERWRRVSIWHVAALLLAALAALDALGGLWPPLGANLIAVVAVLFVLLPEYAEPHLAGEAPPEPAPDVGMVRLRRAGLGLAVALVVLAGFVPGYHVWSTVAAGRVAAPSWHALQKPPVSWEDISSRPTGDVVRVTASGRETVVRWRPQAEGGAVEISAAAGFERTYGRPAPRADGGNAVGTSLARGQALEWRVVPRAGADLVVRAGYEPAHKAVPRWWVGTREVTEAVAAEGGLRVPYDLTWLAWGALVQFLLVAWPEETCFRGFVLRRLHGVWQTVPGGAWWHVSRANVATCAIFALAHVVIGWNPARAVVFFPSLLFGKVWERSGSTTAGIVLHALCNLMMQVAATQYLGAA